MILRCHRLAFPSFDTFAKPPYNETKMTTVEQRLADETLRILDVLTKQTGLSTQWNGMVEVVYEAEFAGKKRFACDIQISADLTENPLRWATLIHEALHSLFAGYVREDYQQFRGWEEGVVEQLQRLWRSRILTELDIMEAEEIFQQRDEVHLYNGYIAALEELRTVLESEGYKASAEEFYVRLLAEPMRNRPQFLLNMGYQRADLPRATFVRALSAANAALTRRIL
jgi:hypothetical protein